MDDTESKPYEMPEEAYKQMLARLIAQSKTKQDVPSGWFDD